MPSLLRSLHLAGPLLYLAGLHSDAQEPVPIERAREFARSLNESAKGLSALAVRVDADVLNPHAIHSGDNGALIVPDRNLSVDVLANVGDTPVPLGELFLRNVSLTTDGKSVENGKLHFITVAMQDRKVDVPIYLLGVGKGAEGRLELLVFSKGEEPIARAPLGKVSARAQMPIELGAEKIDDHSGTLTLNVLGLYEAELLLQRSSDGQERQ